MQALRRSGLVRYLMVPITVLALFSGCYKWTSGGLGQVRANSPGLVRVTTSYLSVHVLKDAVVSGDSLVGADEGG